VRRPASAFHDSNRENWFNEKAAEKTETQKNQHPNFKHQAPGAHRQIWELEIWIFSGGRLLEFGAFIPV
jgi:hypothetical protein